MRSPRWGHGTCGQGGGSREHDRPGSRPRWREMTTCKQSGKASAVRREALTDVTAPRAWSIRSRCITKPIRPVASATGLSSLTAQGARVQVGRFVCWSLTLQCVDSRVLPVSAHGLPWACVCPQPLLQGHCRLGVGPAHPTQLISPRLSSNAVTC